MHNTLSQFRDLENTRKTSAIFLQTECQTPEYWLYSDIAKMYPDYIEQPNPTKNAGKNILNAMLSHLRDRMEPQKLNTIIADHRDSYNTYDERMTRMTTWMLLKQFPQLIIPQIYMLTPGVKFSDMYQMSEKFSRIYWHGRVKTLEQQLNKQLISNKIPTSPVFSVATTAFFAGLNATDVAKHAGINKDYVELTNYMTAPALCECANALEYTLTALNNTPTNTNAKTTMFDAFCAARNHLLEHSATKTIDTVTKTHIDKITKELQKMENKFITEQINKKIR